MVSFRPGSNGVSKLAPRRCDSLQSGSSDSRSRAGSRHRRTPRRPAACLSLHAMGRRGGRESVGRFEIPAGLLCRAFRDGLALFGQHGAARGRINRRAGKRETNSIAPGLCELNKRFNSADLCIAWHAVSRTARHKSFIGLYAKMCAASKRCLPVRIAKRSRLHNYFASDNRNDRRCRTINGVALADSACQWHTNMNPCMLSG